MRSYSAAGLGIGGFETHRRAKPVRQQGLSDDRRGVPVGYSPAVKRICFNDIDWSASAQHPHRPAECCPSHGKQKKPQWLHNRQTAEALFSAKPEEQALHHVRRFAERQGDQSGDQADEQSQKQKPGFAEAQLAPKGSGSSNNRVSWPSHRCGKTPH